MEQTSIKRFRPHPLYILSNLWRYLFILLLPLVRGLYYVVINSFSLTGGFQLAVNISNWLQGAWVDVLSLLAFLSLGVLLWATFVVELTADGLLVRRGVFRREVSFLPASQYYCVSLVAPLRLRVFGAQYLRVDTAGGNLTQADLAGDAAPPRLRADHPHAADPVDGDGAWAHPGVQPEEPVCFCAAMITSNSFAWNGADLHPDYPDGQLLGAAAFRR